MNRFFLSWLLAVIAEWNVETMGALYLDAVRVAETPIVYGVPPTAGGNIGPYPTSAGVVPSGNVNGSTILLQESAVAYPGAALEGFPNSHLIFRGAAESLLAQGVSYRKDPTASMELGAGNWDIKFPGVINIADGLPILDKTNYVDKKVIEAQNAYRDAYYAHPEDLTAAIGILHCTYERMVPRIFAGNNALARAARERILERIGELENLRANIERGMMFFIGGSLQRGISTRAYTPEYVPFFFEPQRFPNITSFSGLSDFAKTLAAESANLDDQTEQVGLQFDQNLFSLAEKLNGILSRSYSDLGQLCGFVQVQMNRQSLTLPDLGGALLPPELREGWLNRTDSDRGEIGRQWLRAGEAENQVEAAIKDLENIYARAQKAAEIATNIAQDIHNLGECFFDYFSGIRCMEYEVFQRRSRA